MILEIAGLLLLVGVAAFFLVPMVRGSKRQSDQAGWPRVRGVITDKRVRMHNNAGYPEYRVRYQVGGEQFEDFVGSPVDAGHTQYGMDYDVTRIVDARMARRPLDSPIDIMVDPNNPRRAFLVERELPLRTIAWIVGTIFLLFFLFFGAVALRLI
jgi:hypothetical protein